MGGAACDDGVNQAPRFVAFAKPCPAACQGGIQVVLGDRIFQVEAAKLLNRELVLLCVHQSLG